MVLVVFFVREVLATRGCQKPNVLFGRVRLRGALERHIPSDPSGQGAGSVCVTHGACMRQNFCLLMVTHPTLLCPEGVSVRVRPRCDGSSRHVEAQAAVASRMCAQPSTSFDSEEYSESQALNALGMLVKPSLCSEDPHAGPRRSANTGQHSSESHRSSEDIGMRRCEAWISASVCPSGCADLGLASGSNPMPGQGISSLKPLRSHWMRLSSPPSRPQMWMTKCCRVCRASSKSAWQNPICGHSWRHTEARVATEGSTARKQDGRKANLTQQIPVPVPVFFASQLCAQRFSVAVFADEQREVGSLLSFCRCIRHWSGTDLGSLSLSHCS